MPSRKKPLVIVARKLPDTIETRMCELFDARLNLTDNLVQFSTARYTPNPLIVQGPGAGPEVTAGGIFADLLRLAAYLGAS